MRHLICITWLVGLACGGPSPDPESIRSDIRAVLEAQATAWNAADIDGYMAGYANSPDLVFASGGKVTKGWQPARDGYVARYGRENMGQLTFHLDEITPLGSDAGIVVGRYELRDTPKAGTGVFTLVVRRGADGWKVTHDHTSATPKAEPKPAVNLPASPDPAPSPDQNANAAARQDDSPQAGEL